MSEGLVGWLLYVYIFASTFIRRAGRVGIRSSLFSLYLYIGRYRGVMVVSESGVHT